MAESAVFMHVPEIEGTGTLAGYDPGSDGSHEGWIPILSCSFSFVREQATVSDNPSDGEAPGPGLSTTVDPIKIERTADVSSAPLLMWLAAEADDPDRRKEKVVIDYCTPSGRYFLRYELEGVELVSSAIGYSAPDEVKETLTFTYRKITVFQRRVGADGEVDDSSKTQVEYTVFEPQQ